MAPDPQTLTFAPAPWCGLAETLLAEAAGCDMANIRAQVVEGGATLFHVMQCGKAVGAFVLRVDHLATHAEGVIVAAEGRVQGVDLIASCLPAIETLFKGCKTIRYHTSRAAMARRLTGMGYMAREIVAVKEIEYGR